MKVLDLFSGIGGFSLGLERAGMQTIAFCEIDSFCHEVLKKHWPEIPIHEDITKLDGKQYVGTVDLICGGFPCQDISIANRDGKGIEGARSGLWKEYARIISEIRPKYIIVENVAELLNRGMDIVLADLAEIGYDAEWHCIPASTIGAPHRRERIWIVAYPTSNNEETFRIFSRITKKSIREAQAQMPKFFYVNHGNNNIEFREEDIPYLCRGNDGLSEKLDGDRLKGCGNAVVPQIPELIGKVIMELNNNASN